MDELGTPLVPLVLPGRTQDDDTVPFINPPPATRFSNTEYRSSTLELCGAGLLKLPGRKAILWYFIAALLLLPHALLLHIWPKGDYGLGVLEENFPCGARGTAFIIFLVDLPLNVIAGLLTYAAGYIGTKAFLPLKICLMLLSIPNHLLYNSLLFQSISARDSYEILVADDFLHTQAPFDLLTVPLLKTSGKIDPLQQDYNMSLPGLHNLTASLTELQASMLPNQTQSTWNNISTKNCLSRYQAGTYDTFSNVIVVSNWTSSFNANNSVLDLTILSGYAGPKHQTRQALVSLCPESFFSTYNITTDQPKEWKFTSGTKPDGFCDPYTPKKFPTAQENVFIKYCLSEEPQEVCRLLYSPLVLKLLFWFLVANLSCMTLALFLQSGRWIDDEDQPEVWRIRVAFGVVTFVFVVMIMVMWFSTSAHHGPRDKSDQTWLLKAFFVINIVQLFDTITDILNVPWGAAFSYTVCGMVWHWFLSGTFAMQVSDRYLLTSSAPGFEVVPYADLASLWFEWLFKILWRGLQYLDILGLGIMIAIFGLPLYARLGSQALICKGVLE